MPALLKLNDGQEVSVNEAVDIAKKKRLAGGWQSFTTVEGNPCKVNMAKVEKITALRS